LQITYISEKKTEKQMARESMEDFQMRMIDKMRDLGFVINNVKPNGWTCVRDSAVDKAHEKSGRFKFDTASTTGSPVCLFKSMKRELPTEFKRGDMSIEFAKGLEQGVLRSAAVVTKEPTLAERLTLTKEQRNEMSHATNATESMFAKASDVSHLYLQNPALNPAGLKTLAAINADVLIVPVYRPAAPDLSKLELSGCQMISTPTNGHTSEYCADGECRKSFVGNTKAGAGFTLIPAVPNSVTNPQKWFDALAKSPKPLVLCEGVGTALAIYQATNLPVIACLSAKNLPVVAEWLKHEGHTNGRAIKVFADNDLDKTKSGIEKQENDKFIGIKEAIKAADILGGKVSVVDNAIGGYDARDLFRDGGDEAVRDAVNNARTVEQLKLDRPEILGAKQEVKKEIEHEVKQEIKEVEQEVEVEEEMGMSR